jgi:hypothetical protein
MEFQKRWVHSLHLAFHSERDFHLATFGSPAHETVQSLLFYGMSLEESRVQRHQPIPEQPGKYITGEKVDEGSSWCEVVGVVKKK